MNKNNTKKAKIIDNWTALDTAVVEQMGGSAQHDEDARRVTVSEYELEECANKWADGEEVEDEEGRAE